MFPPPARPTRSVVPVPPPPDGATTRVAPPPRRSPPEGVPRRPGRPPRRTAAPDRLSPAVVTRLPFPLGPARPALGALVRVAVEGRWARLGAARLADPSLWLPRGCLAEGAWRAGPCRRGADARGAERWGACRRGADARGAERCGARWPWELPDLRRWARRCSSAASIGADQTATRRRLENPRAKRYMMNSLSLSAGTPTPQWVACHVPAAIDRKTWGKWRNRY